MNKFLKKEAIGWSVFGVHYRVYKPKLALALYVADAVGGILFSIKRRKAPGNPRSILIVQLDHIGDMILCTPLIANVRKTYPGSRITLLIRELADPIARRIDGVDEILHLHTPWLSREKNIGWSGVVSFCFKRFRKYDLSFEVHGEARNNLIAWLLSKYRVGMGVRGFGFLLNRNVPWQREYSSHIVDVQLRMLASITGKRIGRSRPSLAIPHESEQKVLDLLSANGLNRKGYLLIQMSVGETNREWPVEYWKQLVMKLADTGWQIICADQDRHKTSFIAEAGDSRPMVHLFRVSLPEYGCLVQNARAVISVETFCNHFASCFNTPSLALYSGVTFIEEWGPLSERTMVLQNRTCPMFPCSLRRCPYGYPSPCMKAITVESVSDGLQQLVGPAA